MRKSVYFILAFCLVLAATPGGKLFAQDSDKAPDAAKAPEPPAHFYHLEFVVHETGSDGKPTNSRSYSGIVSTSRTDRGFSMRTGSRVPIATGSFEGKDKNLPVQFQYVDVGVSIDARDARENGEKLALNLNAEISSLAGPPNADTANQPVIRQNRWQASVLVPIAKSTVVFTSDLLDNKSGMQLVLTVTPVK